MKDEKSAGISRRQLFFLLYMIFLGITSLSIVFMYVGVEMRESNIVPLILAGVLFWVGLIGTAGTAVLLNLARRSSRSFREAYHNKKQFGLIHFFQNRTAFIVDISLFVSLGLYIILRFVGLNNLSLYVILALVVFTFGMHCMLNGINYIYVNYKSRGEKVS